MCKLLIHFNLIITVQCLSPYIVGSFCTASSWTESSCIESSYQAIHCGSRVKLHHQNLSKSKVLSLLSTVMGPVQQPFFPRGVVNPQQTNSGTQCWAYGWWIGPFTYQCDAELLHDITSHPAIKQNQQLAYVSWQAADTKNCTKMVSFCEKTAANVQHFQSSQQADTWQCVIPSHTSLVQGNMCWRTLPKYHCRMPWSMIQRLIPFPEGMLKPGELPRVEGEEPIPSWDGLATYPERWSQNLLVWARRKKTVQWTFYSAGALNFLKSARCTELS